MVVNDKRGDGESRGRSYIVHVRNEVYCAKIRIDFHCDVLVRMFLFGVIATAMYHFVDDEKYAIYRRG